MCLQCPVSSVRGSAGLRLLRPWARGCRALRGGGCLQGQQDGPYCVWMRGGKRRFGCQWERWFLQQERLRPTGAGWEGCSGRRGDQLRRKRMPDRKGGQAQPRLFYCFQPLLWSQLTFCFVVKACSQAQPSRAGGALADQYGAGDPLKHRQNCPLLLYTPFSSGVKVLVHISRLAMLNPGIVPKGLPEQQWPWPLAQCHTIVRAWGLAIGFPRLRCVASLSTFHSKCMVYSFPWPAFLRENPETCTDLKKNPFPNPNLDNKQKKKPRTPYQNKVLYCRNTSFHGQGRTVAW